MQDDKHLSMTTLLRAIEESLNKRDADAQKTESMSEPLDLRVLRKHQRRVAALLNLDAAIGVYNHVTSQRKSLPYVDCKRLEVSDYRPSQRQSSISWKKIYKERERYNAKRFNQSATDDGYDSQSDDSSLANNNKLWHVNQSRTYVGKTMKGVFLKVPTKFSAVKQRRGWLSQEEEQNRLNLSQSRLMHAASASLDSSLNMICEEMGNARVVDRSDEVDETILRRRYLLKSEADPLPPIVPMTSPNEAFETGDVAHLRYSHRSENGVYINDVRELSGLTSRERGELSFHDSPLHIRSYDSTVIEPRNGSERRRCSDCSNTSNGACPKHEREQSRHGNASRKQQSRSEYAVLKRETSTLVIGENYSKTPGIHPDTIKNVSNPDRTDYIQTLSTKTTPIEHNPERDDATSEEELTSTIDTKLNVKQKRRIVNPNIHRQAYVSALSDANKHKFYADPVIFGLKTSRPYVYSFYEIIGHGTGCDCFSCTMNPKSSALPPIAKPKRNNPSKILFGNVNIDDYYIIN